MSSDWASPGSNSLLILGATTDKTSSAAQFSCRVLLSMPPAIRRFSGPPSVPSPDLLGAVLDELWRPD